jgi:hypothetical protein
MDLNLIFGMLHWVLLPNSSVENGPKWQAQFMQTFYPAEFRRRKRGQVKMSLPHVSARKTPYGVLGVSQERLSPLHPRKS